MTSPTPFIDAGDSIAEACAWLKGIASWRPLLSLDDDIEQAQHHLMRAGDALRNAGYGHVHIADEETEAGPMPIMEECIADPVAARAYHALGMLLLVLLEKARLGALTSTEVSELGGFIMNDPEFRERAAGEMAFLESQPDEDDGLKP